MVEIITRYTRLCAATIACFFAAEAFAQQPIDAPTAGLEQNQEYSSLLKQDEQLQVLEEAAIRDVEQLRKQMRENPADRQALSLQILALENKIFEIRTAKGRLIDRINAIEQEWVMANLNGEARKPASSVAESPADAVADSLKVRNLVDNSYFRQELPAADYAALREAQRQEMLAVEYVNRYFANYQTLAEQAAAYASATSEQQAIELYGTYNTLQGLNRVLADSLAKTWNYVFDNKSYAYGYLLDKLRKDEILTREEERLGKAARQLASLRDEVESEVVADYFLRKQVMVDYETAVAQELGLDAARDSLRGVAAQLAAVDFRLPRVLVTERTFLQYDSITFSSSARYNSSHPIPECRIYARGTIYRLQIGTFNTKRPVEAFRGAYPLCYLKNEEGKWVYFAGGFATKNQTEQALKQLRTRGFQRPEIVVWTDGVFRNLSKDPEVSKQTFRVEISGTEALSDAVKRVIVETAAGHELSRVGQQLFVVGIFDDKAVAERVAAAVSHADAALEIKVAEIAQ